MFLHQVVGIRRERSFRSRKSRHIVGVCTLEALDPDGRFHDFAPDEGWTVEQGRVVTTSQPAPQVPRCRSWALEEVVCALAEKDEIGKPVHEFYTRHPVTGKRVKVFARRRQPAPTLHGDCAPCPSWITTRGNQSHRDDLYALPEAPELIACDVVNRCPVIPLVAEPVYRGHGADC